MRRSIDIVKQFTIPDRRNKNQAYFITLKYISEQIFSHCLNTKRLLIAYSLVLLSPFNVTEREVSPFKISLLLLSQALAISSFIRRSIFEGNSFKISSVLSVDIWASVWLTFFVTWSANVVLPAIFAISAASLRKSSLCDLASTCAAWDRSPRTT